MDHYYWFALKSVPQVGNVTFRRLLEHFGTPERALNAPAEELALVRGVGPQLAQAIRGHDYRRDAERECRRMELCGCRLVDMNSPEYPPVLRELPDYPPFLYVKGALNDIDPAVAVVGSRRASTYGVTATRRLAEELAGQGVTVISGMARGIDTAAHQGALAAGGKTVGVLGSGIDVMYPPENRRLFGEMAERGALVSEFPLGTSPLAENFPRRNRIISGLSRGVLVVEAAEKSGSLITAEYALEQGREVFAIPGNITMAGSRGTNRLIKQGAKLVECVEDILDELSFPLASCGKRSEASPLAPEEEALCALLAGGPLQMDEIIATSGLTVGELSAILLRLELRGVITQLPGKHFAVI
ncbi:DNA-processing protein DprA [Geobacter sp. DSM 9736]|uniref:DNA-processing protein DprA n=1 Tax=Geobacter sp. DSM 9736 TaxID=1277350 RepID=UPI000B4FDFD3|nr:DNA-processing protein DprA [Geobacter sp. DSM 9736]SNB48115.1 DNA protecting protein DprA [Geobacter sp. DSM 9736]